MPDDLPLCEGPLVLSGRIGSRRVVAALDARAEAAGLRRGMLIGKAQALVAGLVIREADEAADSLGLHRLALWAMQQISPLVAADLPDGLVMDTAGADHLHGGELSLLESLIARLAAMGIEARAAISDTWGASHALARFSRRDISIVGPEDQQAALQALPIAGLRLDKCIVDGLALLGFERIGDLLAQPRAPLIQRFGPQLGRRLDQALGMVAEPIDPVRSPDLVDVRRMFAEPISAAETIARYIEKLVTALCAALETRGLGARRLDLLCHRVDSRCQAVRIGMAQPVRDVKRLTRMLCDRIDRINPGFGIEVMVLTASLAEPLQPRQATSMLEEDNEPDLSDLLDVLANRVGQNRLYRVAPVASDVPERSVQRVAPLAPDLGQGWKTQWPRPSRLLPHPEPIETMALLPDHPPVWFAWRGQRRRVRAADGPERIFGEWWKRDAETLAVRDYFRVEDEAGERYWIFRAGDGEHLETGSHRWFLHGIFA
ncbi:protein ImuB [Rhizobium taibaishanense]|uniref:DNA-directed DNA polymerase n=1 Tax=Allorhizobium taibaishanense TaxID=887144 RepID=A0A7W6HP63_9HYPH|nr:protein ImuB [Allorhizobium taibaishanense]